VKEKEPKNKVRCNQNRRREEREKRKKTIIGKKDGINEASNFYFQSKRGMKRGGNLDKAPSLLFLLVSTFPAFWTFLSFFLFVLT